jgi:Beta-galactosidase/beta-glucuronidase
MTKINKVVIDYNKIPLDDYPRPQLKRGSYICLNGAWNYTIIKDKDKNKPFSFDKKIIVPYSVETPLSGVNHLMRPDEILIYNKRVMMPEGFKKDLLILHFDGVDQICDIYIDNKKVASHVGGYTRFEIEISKYVILNSFVVTVVVIDPTDKGNLSRGKQCLNRGGIFYTSTSGIYKSVWLESVKKEYIKEIRYTTLYKEKLLRMFIKTNFDGVCKVKINNQEIIMNSNQETLIKLENFHPWSPNDPYLYDVNITFFDDVVKSYFGLREIKIARALDGFPRLYLNNKLIFIKGILDQGYYFLGNLTPESNADYLSDIKNLKELGFNTIRKHIKTESDIFYYYCDVQGMLVIQDFINGGNKYSKKASFWPGVFNAKYKKDDDKYKIYGRNNAEAQTQWINESKTIQRELYSHPSVIMYTIFNEGWGQFDSKFNYERFKENDISRLYDTTSGWCDFGYSDFNSIHNYFFKHKIYKDKYSKIRPYIISEYGGYSLFLKDHFYGLHKFGYKKFKNIEDLTANYAALNATIIPLIRDGLAGTIYTQVSDVEDEVNGLYTFDRKVLKIKKEVIQDINKKIDVENYKIASIDHLQ